MLQNSPNPGEYLLIKFLGIIIFGTTAKYT